MYSMRRLFGKLSKAFTRPQLNFDFLLDPANLSLIEENIRMRKGVGNIGAVHELWHRIQTYSGSHENEYEALWDQFYDEAQLIPNMSHPDAPKGCESNARLVREFGAIKRTSTNLKTAEKIARNWRALYDPVAACGEKSYAFIGPLADLEKSIIEFVTTTVESNGFRTVLVSDVISEKATEGCGVQQRSEKDILYRTCGQDGYCLSGTSELGLAYSVSDRIFEQEELPIKLTALSRCYRPEVASSAVESKLYRVHEFNKVEMFAVCTKEQSDDMLQQLVDIQCHIFSKLQLHCRLLDMPTEELGAPAARKFDIEAWMPGRKLYGEVSSASNCTDYQARRLDIKYKDSNDDEHFAHTCNATAIATTRALIALLETHQNERCGIDKLPVELTNLLPKDRSKVIKMRNAGDINERFTET